MYDMRTQEERQALRQERNRRSLPYARPAPRQENSVETPASAATLTVAETNMREFQGSAPRSRADVLADVNSARSTGARIVGAAYGAVEAFRETYDDPSAVAVRRFGGWALQSLASGLKNTIVLGIREAAAVAQELPAVVQELREERAIEAPRSSEITPGGGAEAALAASTHDREQTSTPSPAGEPISVESTDEPPASIAEQQPQGGVSVELDASLEAQAEVPVGLNDSLEPGGEMPEEEEDALAMLFAAYGNR